MNLIVVYIAASSSSLQNFISDPFVQDLFAKHVTNATSMASPSSSQFFFFCLYKSVTCMIALIRSQNY